MLYLGVLRKIPRMNRRLDWQETEYAPEAVRLTENHITMQAGWDARLISREIATRSVIADLLPFELSNAIAPKACVAMNGHSGTVLRLTQMREDVRIPQSLVDTNSGYAVFERGFAVVLDNMARRLNWEFLMGEAPGMDGIYAFSRSWNPDQLLTPLGRKQLNLSGLAAMTDDQATSLLDLMDNMLGQVNSTVGRLAFFMSTQMHTAFKIAEEKVTGRNSRYGNHPSILMPYGGFAPRLMMAADRPMSIYHGTPIYNLGTDLDGIPIIRNDYDAPVAIDHADNEQKHTRIFLVRFSTYHISGIQISPPGWKAIGHSPDGSTVSLRMEWDITLNQRSPQSAALLEGVRTTA